MTPLAGTEPTVRNWFHRLVNAREYADTATTALAWLHGILRDLRAAAAPDSADAALAMPAIPAGSDNALPDAAALAFHAPLALLEGSFIQAVAQAPNGHIEAVAELFSAYLLLLGADAAQSPAFAYRGALARAGVLLPPVSAWCFAHDDRVGAASMQFASVQLALAMHPRALFPELLGFALAYVDSDAPWRLAGLAGPRREALLAGMARAIRRALRAHLADGGCWGRVRRGYALYLRTANDYRLVLRALGGQALPLAGQVAAIFRRKRRFALGFHGRLALGGRGLETWFAEPSFDAAGFLAAFAASAYAAGVAGERPFDRLTAFGGPMFGVFDREELALIGAWLDGGGIENLEGTRISPVLEGLSPPCPGASPAAGATSRRPSPVPFAHAGEHGNRALFHRLINADLYPWVVDIARRRVDLELARSHRALGRLFFDYSPEALGEFVDRVHGEEVARYRPFSPPPRLQREEYVWGIVQFAPAILVDGCWLQHLGEAANQDHRLHRLLYRIYADELGAGEVRRNHPKIYRDLLTDLGVELAPVDSKAFAHAPAFLDAAFDLPVFLLAISQFPRSRLPEILGLNLAIELSGLGAQYLQLADELRYWNIDPFIVTLHQSIDNLAGGHAALAVEAVRVHLDEVRAAGGDGMAGEHWRRVWSGYRSLETATRRFKWALGLNFCRLFLPRRIARRLYWRSS